MRHNLILLLLPLACGDAGTGGESDSIGPGPIGTSTLGTGPGPTTGDPTDPAPGTSTGTTAELTTDDPPGPDSTTGGVKYDLAGQPDVGGGDEGEATCEQAAKNLSNAGCLFAPTVGSTVELTLPWAVVAANTSADADATVKLFGADGALIEMATVPVGQLHTFVFAGNSPPLLAHAIESVTGVTKQSLRLESDRPVVAYQFLPYSSSQVATADASLLLPEHAWADDYLVPSYHNSDFSDSWVSVISLVDGNEVTIEMPIGMTDSTSAGGSIPALVAGASHTETIDAQQVLRVVSPGSSTADLTGMRVRSSGPVAVMSGSPLMSLPGPGMNAYKDYLEEQIPPRSAWGKDYAVVKFRPRSDEGDLYRFLADKDGTLLTLSGGGVDEQVMLDAGEFYQLITAADFRAEGSEAFMVAHYMVSSDQSHGPKDEDEYPGPFQSPKNCQNPDPNATELGDPAISFIVPTDQFRTSYTFLTPATYAWDMLTVVAPLSGWGSIQLDGAPLPAPTELGFSDLGRARMLIPDGPHDIRSAATEFGIEVYGYDCRISYAYPGGLRLGKINMPPD